MLRLISHINYLLTIHDCVVIPQVGGFVLETASANYDKDKHSFSPLHTEILFNPSLTYDNGLLANSYMKIYQVGFKKAQSMVEDDVKELKAIVSKYGKIDLGVLGSFSLGGNGQMVFSASASEVFEANNYGLMPFSFPVLPAIVSVDDDKAPELAPQKKADVFYLPISRRFIRTVATTAAAIGLFLLLSTPVKDVNPSAFTASFVPSTEMIRPATPITESIQPETSAINNEIAAEAPASDITSVEEEATMPTPDMVQPAVKAKKYYIIIGSFPNEPLANQFIAGVDSKHFADVGIVEREEKHRVYAYVYGSREEAEAQLEAVRQIDKYENAWLFITR